MTATRERRGWAGAWPRWMRVLVAVGGIVIAVALAVVVHAVAAGPPRRFPGQYPFSGQYDYPTTVSAGQAFHDHWLIPPPGIRDLRYAADSPGYSYPYPFVAVFAFPCTEIPGFVEASKLQYGGTGPASDGPLQDADVQFFAQAQGWRATDRMVRWYYRAVPETPGVWEQVMITGRTACTGYIASN